MKYKQNIIWASSALLILIAISAIVYCDKYFPSPKIKADSKLTAVIDLETSPRNENQSIEVPKENIVSPIADLRIPILMYHHIRDYSNPTDQIGTNLSVPTEKFAAQLDLIQKDGYTTTTFADLENGIRVAKPIILTFDDGYENFYQNAFPELKKRNMKAVSFVIAHMTGGDYMTDSQLKEISDYGIEIGDHTFSHPDLTTVSSTEVENEIAESKKELESRLGKDIISFCYPSGKYNDAVIDIVRKSGYKIAVTTKSGIGEFFNLLALHRYRINNDTNIESFLK